MNLENIVTLRAWVDERRAASLCRPRFFPEDAINVCRDTLVMFTGWEHRKRFLPSSLNA